MPPGAAVDIAVILAIAISNATAAEEPQDETQYRNDPAVSTTVWYRSGQPKGAPWTNQWGWQDATIDNRGSA